MPRYLIGILALQFSVLAQPIALLESQSPGQATSDAYDLVIRGGRVLDGTGNPWIRADVGVRGGRVAAMGDLSRASADRVIDAKGLYVTPGFIDVHSHAAEGLARDGLQQGRPMLAQGVTTVVINPDGGGAVDLAAQRQGFEANGLGINVAQLIGHGVIRRAVLQMDDRAPSPGELDRMRALVRTAMEEGAFGLSSGLFYAPGSYAATEEVIALARIAGEFGGVYESHIRDESDYSVGVVAAVSEVIRIAEEAGLPGIVTHMKALGPDNWGLAVASTTKIDAARARGVEVFADQYPYAASSTSVTGALIPRWAQVGGEAEMKKRIEASSSRERLLSEVRENIRRRGGPETLVVARFQPEPDLEGRSLAAIADAWQRSPEESALDLAGRGRASLVSFNMSDADLEHIMRQTYTITSSDGGLVAIGEGKPHPRNYGAFARKLAVYVRERRTVGLESAVRSMSSLPALVFRLRDRGVLREGAWADVAVFDPAAVRDTATFTDPHQLAQGMSYVLVNGVVVVDEGQFTDALPGQVLRR